jgi:hypothetical protein
MTSPTDAIDRTTPGMMIDEEEASLGRTTGGSASLRATTGEEGKEATARTTDEAEKIDGATSQHRVEVQVEVSMLIPYRLCGDGVSLGGGGGRGRGGRGRDMSAVSDVLALLSGQGMSDEDILRVLQPSPEDIAQRETLCVNDITRLPPVESWRFDSSSRIGCVLDSSSKCVILSNHFRVDVQGISPTIYQYHMHVKKHTPYGLGDDVTVNSAGSDKETAKKDKEDRRLTTILLGELKKLHKEWFEYSDGRPKMGFCYDGVNTIFTTSKIPYEGEFLREDVTMPLANGSSVAQVCHKLFCFLCVSEIFREGLLIFIK